LIPWYLVCIHTNTKSRQSAGFISLFCPRTDIISTIIPDALNGVYFKKGSETFKDAIKKLQSKPIMVIYAWSFLDASNFCQGESSSRRRAHGGIFLISTPMFLYG
jgi:hypothetical protein